MGKKPENVYNYRGEEYTTSQLYQIACQEYGCTTSYRGFQNRLANGSVTEAVECTKRQKPKKKYWYRGKWRDVDELYEIACEQFNCNVTYKSFGNRLSTWDKTKDAVEQFPQAPKKRGYTKATPHKYKRESDLDLPPLYAENVSVPAMQKMAVHMLRAVDTDLRYGGPRARESAISWLSDEQEVVRWAGAFPDDSSRYFRDQAHKMLNQVTKGEL